MVMADYNPFTEFDFNGLFESESGNATLRHANEAIKEDMGGPHQCRCVGSETAAVRPLLSF
jgi:hypothetical protein